MLSSSIPEKNITCLTRLDHYRALSQTAERLNVYVTEVRNVIIWGNHSSTQYPDVNHAIVTTKNGERPVKELDTDDHWLKNKFINTVQQHGTAIIKARKASSALSVASAACDHMRDWVLGTPKERGFPWECILMVLMGSQRILFTLFLLNVRKENGQL